MKRALFLTVILMLCATAFAQSDYYAKKAKDYVAGWAKDALDKAK